MCAYVCICIFIIIYTYDTYKEESAAQSDAVKERLRAPSIDISKAHEERSVATGMHVAVVRPVHCDRIRDFEHRAHIYSDVYWQQA
jgi:hypothetical protein